MRQFYLAFTNKHYVCMMSMMSMMSMMILF